MALDPDLAEKYVNSKQDAEDIEELRENPVEYLRENNKAYTAGEIAEDVVPRSDFEDEDKLPQNKIYNQLSAAEEKGKVKSFYLTQAEIKDLEEKGEIPDAEALIDASVPVGTGTGEENKYRFFAAGKEYDTE